MHRWLLFAGLALVAGCSKQTGSDVLSRPTPITSKVEAPTALKGISQSDRARLKVYEYEANVGCDLALSESALFLLQGKGLPGQERLSWGNIRDHLDTYTAHTATQFSTVVLSLKNYPELVSALKQHRNIVNECNRDTISNIATGSISAESFKRTHSEKLSEVIAKINTELDLLPVVAESQSSIPLNAFKN